MRLGLLQLVNQIFSKNVADRLGAVPDNYTELKKNMGIF